MSSLLHIIDKEEEKEEESNRQIEINTLFNPLSEGAKYQTTSNEEKIIEQILSSYKDKQEKKEKEKDYNFKERIFYNNIPSDYITKTKSDSTNTYYFEKFFELKEDFDHSNYANLINMRTKYLSTLFKKEKKDKKSRSFDLKEENLKLKEKEKKEIDEKKEENEKKEEKIEVKNENNKKEGEIKEDKKDGLKNEEKKEEEKKDGKKEEIKEEKNEITFDENEFKNKDTLYSLFADLSDMMNYQEEQGDQFLHYSILERIFSNLFFEIETFFDKSDLNKHALYETKLCECIDLFENNFISKKENINNKSIHFLYQLQKISLMLKSCGGFLKILKLMKSKNIVFDNYNSIYEKNFKFNLLDSIEKIKKENDSNKLFEISTPNEVTNYEFCTDKEYLYLCYDSTNKNYFKLEKYCLSTGKKKLEKEIENNLSYTILNDYKDDKLKILIFKQKNEFQLLIINKNDFLIEKQLIINSPIERAEFIQILTSSSFFFLISVKQIYKLSLSNENKTPVFNTFIELKKIYAEDKSYFFIWDDYIKFSCKNEINITKKSITGIPFQESNKNNERYYCDNFNNIFYNIRYIKGKNKIVVNTTSLINFKFSNINSNAKIKLINEEIESNLSILFKKYPKNENKEEKEEKIIDPFKHYLEYSNNLESLLNLDEKKIIEKDKIKFKIDKDLSENYYSFLFSAIIKYFYYNCLKNESKNQSLIFNINNDIMFNIVKELLKEKKDHIILYIYVYFLIQNDKNKNEKIDEKINWIVKFCLGQEQLSIYLNDILNEIYKYEPKYINSTNIAKDLISSKKLSFEEQICYFSLINLKEKKEIFIELLEKFLSIEKIIILSNEENLSYPKKLYNKICENFINYFKDPKIYDFKKENFWKEFHKILEIFINFYNSLLTEVIKPENKNKINNMIIKNSVVCQILFLLINILLFKVEKLTQKNLQIDFIKLFLKTLILSRNYSEKESIEHNIEKEEIIISQYKCTENPDEINNNLTISTGNVYLEYDLETNFPYKMSIGKISLLNGCPTDIVPIDLSQGKNLSSISINISADNIIKDNDLKRFKLKLSNFKNDESNSNILVDIRKSILFFILISAKNKCKMKTTKNEDKIEAENKEILDEKINKIIKSQFFKDISIISKKNKIIENQKYFDFNINEVLDNKKISEEYENNYVKIIKSILEDKEEENDNNNIININPTISSIIENLLKNDSFKKLLSVIHQEFIKKNPWGSINENILKNIIINIFGIILYEYDLFNEFEELVILNNKNKLPQDNNKLKMFISIYSKINIIRKLVSKKKQDFSVLKDAQKKDEEVLIKKYISEINNKINFIIDNKKRKDEQDNNKNNKKEENIENIEKTISFLINYLADDMITESSIEKGMEKLNENLIDKERNLNYLNKLLYISNKAQDIKDLISCVNYIIKNGGISFNEFDMELLGTDNFLINKYKKQVFIYLLQIINKLKNSDKNNYDISYYFTLINSLYCPFSKDDYKFIEISKLYDIFDYKSNKNKLNNLLLSHNSKNFTKINDDDIKYFKISYDSLYKESFNLFKLMTFLAINQFNEINDNQENPFVKTIFDFIIKIFDNYIEEMDDFKNKRIKINEITNEEKLNSFLILFYRCILKNNIRDSINKYYNNIISILFYILVYSSAKNKIICLKIIEVLFINDSKLDESSMKNKIESFKKELKEKNLSLYNFIYLNKINHIDNAFIEFLFNFALILQQKIDNIIKFINGTENNMALSLIIIKMIQNKLLKQDNSYISNNIIKFIESNYLESKLLTIILQILGVDINYKYISSFIELENNKKGIILCFSNIPIKNESFTNFSNINYCKGEYIYYIHEDDIFTNFLTNLDINIESKTINNIKVIMNNIPILPLEKNKLLSENLIENISKFEEKDIYLILRYIKILLLEENIKLDNKIISFIMEKSLSKEILNFKCKIVTLEILEKMMIPYILESNPLVFVEKVEKKDDINTESESGEPLFVDPFQPDILLDDETFFYRCYEDHSLCFHFNYSKIINLDLFNKPKKFLKIFDNTENAKKYKENCILMTKELLTLEKISSNIKYIIIPDSYNEEDLINNKIQTVPIIMIETLTFNNILDNTFKNLPFDELQDIYAFSLENDVSSLIEIPYEKIPEFCENQRDILIEVLNEEPNYEAKNNNDNEDENDKEEQNNEPYYEEFKNILCGNKINTIDKKLIFNKLISLICRRLAIIVKMTQKIKIPYDDLKKLVKLLLYENLTEISKEAEIFQILKNFVLITSIEDDIETIKCFTDISFLDSKDIISDSQSKDIQTEFELLKYENLNNDIFLVDWFFICQYANNKTNILNEQFVIDYLSKLIKQNSIETVTFILRLFKYIEKNFNAYIKIIEKNKNVFCSKELIQLFDSCEKILQEHLNNEGDNIDFNQNLYEKLELFFVFFNIAFKLKINYNIDLETNYYENSLLLNIYKIVSMLLYINEDIKSDVNYSSFVELCYQKGIYKYLIDCDQFTKPLKTIKLNYYDKSFNSNFVMNFQNLIPKNLENGINSLSLILRGVDDKLINSDNCSFIYESEKCNHLQDYVKKFDRPNDKRILLLKDNFTISYPYKNFFSYLYGAGYNDKNSLGIQIGNKQKFSVPQPCVGLEECKNIIDFKFGYYHTFVQTADGNLLTCGTDKGSSFRCATEFPFFNKQTYFYSLSKENGGIKTIAANNYNSSILLTNNNKLFCCGKNNTCCLGNSIEGEGEIDIPVEMPEFLPVIKELKPPYIVKEIACGYKSTLFLLEEGYAFTCGSQDFSQCGSKEKVSNYREYFPLYPPRGTKFTHVVAGEEFFLFLVEEINEKGYGKLYSLGQNEFGRSGAGELNLNYTLQRLEEVEDKNFCVISSRNENAAAISTEGELYTFGNNASFALGLGNSKNVYVPTKVEALKDYICDNVGISQHHMIVIARRKESGKKVVLSCGDNQFRAICQDIDNDNAKIKIPTEIKFFLEKRPDEEPIRASLSRYQTYLLSLKVDLREKINKILSDFKCIKCQKDNQYSIFFNIDENKKINYYCNNCVIANNNKIFYALNTIDDDTKDNLEKIINDKEKIDELCLSFEENQNDIICLHCNKKIIINVYQSYSNEKLILCQNCYMSKCPLIEYPQLFICYNSDIILKKKGKKTNFDSILYPNIVKNEKPYLEFDVIANYKKEYIIKELYKNKQISELYNNTFKLINKNILKEMRKFKEFYEESKFNYLIEQEDVEENKIKEENQKEEENKKEEEKKEKKEEINKIIEEKKEEVNKIIEEKEETNKIIEEKKEENKKENEQADKDKEKVERKIEYKNYEFLANIAGKSNKYLIYEIIKKLIEQKNKTDIDNQEFKNLNLYKDNNKLYNLSFELSNRINNQIFKILDLSIKFQFPTIFRKVIENSLLLISSQERKEIFQKNISNKRVSINAENIEITISRIKANLFYTKNQIDKDGVYTVFSQLYRKTRNYAKKNYLSNKNNRLFSVRLQGEGASDFSGVYNEIISIISFELQSQYLDLFIKTPNNKNEIGQNRDKYMPNPLAKSYLNKEMYYFIGNLMLHAISSGNVLNLNLHPIFYKKILKQNVSFKDIETVDKLSYKFIISLESIKDESEFNEKHSDLFFAVHSSYDNSLIDLVKEGKSKKVTFDQLPEYIKLYKEFLINEIDEQVANIRKGIFDILDENLSLLLTPQDLEDYICGTPKINLQLLREKTRYDGFESDSPVIINFWKALESFSEEEKSKYLRFVSGRCKLPDPRNIIIDHKISLSRSRNPDKRMPTSQTCYFTLNLPNYSTYEILRDKLRYVINNCCSIDADFFPEDGGDAFNEE